LVSNSQKSSQETSTISMHMQQYLVN